MMGGISLVGVVTATLASWIVQRVAQEDSEDRAATAAQIEAACEEFRLQIKHLRDEVQKLTEVTTPQQPALGTHNGHPVDAVRPIRNWLTGTWRAYMR